MLVMPASAQTALPQNSRVRPERQQISQATDSVRTEFLNAERQAIQNFRQVTSSTRQEFLQQEAQIRQNFQNAIKAERERVQNKISAYKEKLKSRLSELKNQAKAREVRNIDDALLNLNNQMVDRFTNALNQLSEVLDRIQTRIDSASSRGLNVTTVTADMTAARTAISNVSVAVQAQAAKVYEISISTSSIVESTSSTSTPDIPLRNDVKTVRNALRSDLINLENQVKSARDLVHKAAVDLAQIHGIDNDLTATSTSEQQNSSTSQTAETSSQQESTSGATSSQ